MLITVKNVDIENKGKYSQAVVTYLDKGQEKTRNVVSFGDSADAYHELKNAKDGDSFNIELKKDGKYWNWVGAERSSGSTHIMENDAKNNKNNAPHYSYPDRESRDERERRQVYIVRQSSISSALEWFKMNEKQPSIDDVIEVARAFEAFVFEPKEKDKE